MLQEAVYRLLVEKARVIRSHIIAMVGEAGSGHPGGSLSAADILAVLYFHHMNIDAARPDWEHRTGLYFPRARCPRIIRSPC